MAKLSGQSWYVVGVVAICAAAVGYVFLAPSDDAEVEAQQNSGGRTLEKIPFDGTAAYKHLEVLCALGPRPSGSQAMLEQQKLLTEHFERLGAKVERQEFRIRHPRDGTAVELANLIVQWHPDRSERLLLLAHYDTRPYPDRDPTNKRGRFVGANDGASGVALMMELGRSVAKLEGSLGVDFLFVDGEEFVFQDPPDKYFLGSTHFAEQYAARPPTYRYRAGVLLDMVGDTRLTIRVEPRSARSSMATVNAIWGAAKRLGVREFLMQMGQEVNDDHVPLNEIAHIPTIDLIDFDYPFWHTAQDTPANCSALSLARVGWVLDEWLKETVKADAAKGDSTKGDATKSDSAKKAPAKKSP
jgi:hypothetical protein